jgi:hypothetical protein
MAVFRHDDRGSKDLWNVGKLLPDYTALQPGRQPSSYSPPWEPQILTKTSPLNNLQINLVASNSARSEQNYNSEHYVIGIRHRIQ